MDTSNSWDCHKCGSSMTVVENAQKHTYECARPVCRARAVIMHKGGNDPSEVFRWNLPAAPEFPSTEVEATPGPKDGASSGLNGGRGERIVSGQFRTAAISDLLQGRNPLSIVNTAMPEGVTIIEADGELVVKDDRQEEATSEGPDVRRNRDGEEPADDVYV